MEKKHIKIITVLFILIYIPLTLSGLSGDSLRVNQLNPRTVKVVTAVKIKNTGYNLSQIVLIIPNITTHHYQTVIEKNTYGGEVVELDYTDESYLRFDITGDNLTKPGTSRYYGYSAKVEIYALDYDLANADQSPYLSNIPEEFDRFVGRLGNYIIPDHPRICQIKNQLTRTTDNPYDYALAAYQYVVDQFNYCNPATGMHDLETLFNWNGRDCANLSSIYISILRANNIPSRHVVVTNHVWSEFYLQNYGWIPVDISYGDSDKSQIYVGDFNNDNNYVVLTRDGAFDIEVTDTFSTENIFLQQHYYYFRYQSGSGQIISEQYYDQVVSDNTSDLETLIYDLNDQ